jgi:prepilin-type processing-associated H-X9-DG protein
MIKRPNGVTSACQSQQAFSFIDLVAAIFGVLAVAFVLGQMLIFNQRRSARLTCSNNMKQVGLAFKVWAFDNGGKYPMAASITNGGTLEFIEQGLVFPHFQVASNELSTPKVLLCPKETRFDPATNFTTDLRNAKLSYLVGLDASDDRPSSILAGDKNLQNPITTSNRVLSLSTNSTIGWTRALHSRKGNVLFADGSVHEIGNNQTRALIKGLGARTNRLAVP